jgi:hypothetical protein
LRKTKSSIGAIGLLSRYRYFICTLDELPNLSFFTNQAIFISKKQEDKFCIIPKLESLRNNWNIDFGND